MRPEYTFTNTDYIASLNEEDDILYIGGNSKTNRQFKEKAPKANYRILHSLTLGQALIHKPKKLVEIYIKYMEALPDYNSICDFTYLDTCFVRRLNGEEFNQGTVFIDIFRKNHYPHNNPQNRATISLISPNRKDYKNDEEFLKAVRLAAENIYMSLHVYNVLAKSRNDLKVIPTLLVCAFSTGRNAFRPDDTKIDPQPIVSKIIQGFKDALTRIGSDPNTITTIKCPTIFERCLTENSVLDDTKEVKEEISETSRELARKEQARQQILTTELLIMAIAHNEDKKVTIDDNIRDDILDTIQQERKNTNIHPYRLIIILRCQIKIDPDLSPTKLKGFIESLAKPANTAFESKNEYDKHYKHLIQDIVFTTPKPKCLKKKNKGKYPNTIIDVINEAIQVKPKFREILPKIKKLPSIKDRGEQQDKAIELIHEMREVARKIRKTQPLERYIEDVLTYCPDCDLSEKLKYPLWTKFIRFIFHPFNSERRGDRIATIIAEYREQKPQKKVPVVSNPSNSRSAQEDKKSLSPPSSTTITDSTTIITDPTTNTEGRTDTQDFMIRV